MSAKTPEALLELMLTQVRAQALVPEEEFERFVDGHRAQLLAVISTNLPPEIGRPNTSRLLTLDQYDAIVVAFSGGKDSLAALLHLLDLLNGDTTRVELWHHLVDGERSEALWDWPVTSSYCEAVARDFGLPLYFSWRQGGFEGEMLRDNQPTGPITTQMPDGSIAFTGGNGPPGTRRRFPQVSADLSVRWCSSYLKIDPCATAIRMRWPEGKVLLITGERREESGNRRQYPRVERHRATSLSRRVDQWRPVLDWTEKQVWSRIREAGIVPHPAYQVGYGRLSCACCIFGGADEWATFQAIRPEQWQHLVELEASFDRTLKRGENITQLSARGTPLPGSRKPSLVGVLNADTFPGPVRVDPEHWQLPDGAFMKTGGPV